MADPLETAQQLAQAREDLTVNAIADGAVSHSPGALAGAPFDVGHIVRDTRTGLYGVVNHVARHEVIRKPAK